MSAVEGVEEAEAAKEAVSLVVTEAAEEALSCEEEAEATVVAAVVMMLVVTVVVDAASCDEVIDGAVGCGGDVVGKSAEKLVSIIWQRNSFLGGGSGGVFSVFSSAGFMEGEGGDSAEASEALSATAAATVAAASIAATSAAFCAALSVGAGDGVVDVSGALVRASVASLTASATEEGGGGVAAAGSGAAGTSCQLFTLE